jgi:dCTP deaminase
MILSNVEILQAIDNGEIRIEPLEDRDPGKKPFNTTSIDLRLGAQISIPKRAPAAFDLRSEGIAQFLAANSTHFTISHNQPYCLPPNQFVLGRTKEKVSFPIAPSRQCYSARVEGRSSLARCGLLVHFTAPTIHAGFDGTLTLEMINLGPLDFLLHLEMYICQLIIEEVRGGPVEAPNQFKLQETPSGTRSKS